MNYYLMAFKKYAQFNGRSRRSEYWYFTLFNLIVYAITFTIDFSILGANESGIGILTIIYVLAIFIPGLAVSIRRLHDIGKSGWNILFGLIPFVGAIILIVFYVKDSDPGTNVYGPNPKGIGNEELIDQIGMRLN